MAYDPYTPPATSSDLPEQQTPSFITAVHVSLAVFVMGSVFYTFERLGSPGDDASFLIAISVGYAIKVIILLVWRTQPLTATVAYVTFAAAAMTAYTIVVLQSVPDRSWIDLLFCDPMILLLLPTITFFLDLYAFRPRSIPVLTWRSVAEITIGLPVVLVILDFAFKAGGLRS